MPQYSVGDSINGSTVTMIEVLRSKVYYASARSMVILPKFSPLLQLPGQAVIMPLFNSVLRLLDKRSKEGSASAAMAHQAMMSIRQSGQVAEPGYFSRVWTLVCSQLHLLHAPPDILTLSLIDAG